MTLPRVLVLRAPGANCDLETQFAFERAGARAERIHVNVLRQEPRLLQRYQVLAIPGGFAYGDDIAAGKILGQQLSDFLAEALQRFRDSEKLILGICNGFQALVKAGLIVPPDEDGPLLTLASNQSKKYEDRWVTLRVSTTRCPFLKDYDTLILPVGHAEGRLVFRERWIGEGLNQAGQVALRYTSCEEGAPGYPANPNGSEGAVAGLCDATGRVLGLMPHPDRFIFATQHPQWTRRGFDKEGDGMRLFRNAVDYFK